MLALRVIALGTSRRKVGVPVATLSLWMLRSYSKRLPPSQNGSPLSKERTQVSAQGSSNTTSDPLVSTSSINESGEHHVDPSPSTRVPPRRTAHHIQGKQVKSSDGVAAPLADRAAAALEGNMPGPKIKEEETEFPYPQRATVPGQQNISPLNADLKSPPIPFPTTLPAQTSSSSFASQMLDLASETPPPRQQEDEGPTGARSKTGKRSMSSIEKKRQTTGRIMMAFMTITGGLWAWGEGRPWETDRERRVLGGGEEGTRATRSKARIIDAFDYFNKPAWEPLIPAPLPEPHGRPYTLLIDIDDILVHSSWDREHGWRTAKRPGVDYFLGYLSQLYEIVIFTTQPSYTAIPICEKLDPYGIYSPYKLFKESCRSKGVVKPSLIKDLDYLGRDLSKVIWLDTKPELYSLHTDNGFEMNKWTGSRLDGGLIEMIPLLEAIAFNQVRDVRDVVRAYKGKDPIKAYTESESRQKKELVEAWEERRKRSPMGGMSFGSLFGISANKANEAPKLLIEKDRERAQQAYVEEQKYWKDNEASLKKLMEEDREKQMKEMKNSLVGFLTGGMQPPKPADQRDTSASPSS